MDCPYDPSTTPLSSWINYLFTASHFRGVTPSILLRAVLVNIISLSFPLRTLSPSPAVDKLKEEFPKDTTILPDYSVTFKAGIPALKYVPLSQSSLVSSINTIGFKSCGIVEIKDSNNYLVFTDTNLLVIILFCNYLSL
mgnify:FL=1